MSSSVHRRAIIILLHLLIIDELDNAVVVQSNKCSKTEVMEKIQCFDNMPLDRYEVLQNSSVVIQCVVLNQNGKVQWRAQNVVLGYDRSVPGMERLRIIGDASRGEHNLQISNVQPEDSGEYECQVQPVHKHPLLRRKTRLLVLVPPTTPIILHHGKRIIDKSIVINPLRDGTYLENPFLTLQCLSMGSDPNFHFIWYWNRKIISQDLRPEVQVTSISNNTSQIILQTKELKSNDKIQCIVENKASQLLRQNGKLLNPLSASVDLKFYQIPGHPEILNSSEITQRIYEENENLNIACRVHPIGSPVPELKWYLRFNTISKSDLSYNEQISLNKDKLEIKSNPITVDQFNDEISTQLTSFRLSRFHHAANVCCAVNYVVAKSDMTSCVMIHVRFPPTKLILALPLIRNEFTDFSWVNYSRELQSVKDMENVTLIDGRNYVFSCWTDLHFTRLRLVWSLSRTTDSKEPVSLEDGEQIERIVERDFRQTISYINVRVTRSMINKYIQCTAWPMNNVVLSTEVRLGINYAPDKPHLSGYASSKSLHEHETMSLLCTSMNGNPLPDLNWYRDNILLSNREPVVSNGNTVTSLLTFKVSREDNGKAINCAAKNIATRDNGVYSNKIVIRVLFPARRISIKTEESQFKNILEDSILSLTCETDSSNPPGEIQWWKMQCLYDNSKTLKRHVPCSKMKLTETYNENIATEFNGWKTISRLNQKVEWSDHNSFLECGSRKPDYGSDVSTAIQYDRIRLNIRFRPHFPKSFLKKSTFKIKENQTLFLNLEAKANPDQIQYSWFRDNRGLIPNTHVRINGSRLSVGNILRNYKGNYTLIASNEIGKSEFRFYVDVTHPPSINGTKLVEIAVKNGYNVSVSCDFDANPYSTQYIKWTVLVPLDVLSTLSSIDDCIPLSVKYCKQSHPEKVSYNSRRKSSVVACSVPREFTTVSSYTVGNASLYYNAILQCMYDNNISPFASKSFTFHVEMAPQHLDLIQFSRQGVENKKPATFTCIFSGNPIKIVQWFDCTVHNNSTLSISNNSTVAKITNRTLVFEGQNITQLRPNIYRSEATIMYHSSMTLSRICCKVRNQYGSDTGVILVQSISHSFKPDKLSIKEVQHNSIMIRWAQSFDGGTAQTFKIQYTEKGLDFHKNETLVSGSRLRNILYFNISALRPNTCYNIRIGSFNEKYKEVNYSELLEACTLQDPNLLRNQHNAINIENSSFPNYRIPKEKIKGFGKSKSFIVTVAGCVFGFVIFIINILTFIICYKRKQEKRRKRRQSKEIQSVSNRQVENFSKFESSIIENNLYDDSMITSTDSYYVTESRGKEEEIPMLIYPKSVCPLHFPTSDQFSNPLIIQDHFLHANLNCSQINDKEENSCYGCTSMDLPINNVIISNQYIPFPIVHSPYNSIFSSACDHSSGNSTISGQLQGSIRNKSALSSCSIVPMSTQIQDEIKSPRQNRFTNQRISDPRQSPPSPIFVRRQFGYRGND